MSSDHSSDVVYCQSDDLSLIDTTTVSSSSITILSSSSIGNSSLTVREFTPGRITRLLKNDSLNYKVIKNIKNSLSSMCWQIFGLPSKKSHITQEFEPIPGFVSCQACFQTYAFTSSSGTRVLNAHSCVQALPLNARKRSSSAGGNEIQVQLGTAMKCYKQVRLPEKQIDRVKDLTCKWLCQDMRSFSTVEDIGLRNLLQEFINLGAKYGEIDVKNALRGADVSAKHIYKLADDYRAELRDLLIEPYENGCICVSPDMWSDPYKQISYMGISITFTDKNHVFQSLDLCCEPYLQSDHSAENILLSIQQCLEPFGLTDFNKLSFVSDRGPNLVCALRDFDTLFCYPHRVNNVLKCSFFQLVSMEKQIKEASAATHRMDSTNITTSTNVIDSLIHEENDDRLSLSTDDDDDDDEKNKPTRPMKTKKRNKPSSTKTNDVSNPRKLKFADLHPSAQEVIKTITRCKNLVRFVKKSGCNKDIQSHGGVALQQSTVVRWLSLINLLESIVRSYKATKRVLISRKQHSKLNGIDEEVLKQLILLLKPFKHVLKIIQTTKSPSLYMVLVCTHMLKRCLGSFDELLKYQTESSTNESDDAENNTVEEIGDIIESEGIKIIRLRILELFNNMFELDIRHYVSTLMHPRYRQLKGCTNSERRETYNYIRKRMNEIIKMDKQQQQEHQVCEPPQKKSKAHHSILQQFEDDSDCEQFNDEINSSDNEDHAYSSKVDELARYLSMNIDKSTLTENPLDFWRENQAVFPILSKVARQIHSIPASSAAVERQFSGAGIVINERRTALDPDQVNNILFIRSMENMKLVQ